MACLGIVRPVRRFASLGLTKYSMKTPNAGIVAHKMMIICICMPFCCSNTMTDSPQHHATPTVAIIATLIDNSLQSKNKKSIVFQFGSVSRVTLK